MLQVGAVRRILHEIMGGTEEFFTHQELERDCCGQFMRNLDPQGLGRCGCAIVTTPRCCVVHAL